MKVQLERNLEALIYSDHQGVSARCAEAFSELPVDWIRTEDPMMAQQLLSSSNFDFVILDIDSPSGTTLLPTVRPSSADRQHSVVLAITGGGIDPDILEMSYESLIFYPVRPEDICSEVHRAMPLAERIAPRVKTPEVDEALETVELDEPEQQTVADLAYAVRDAAAPSIARVAKTAMSIVWQERIASMISALGTIWYVHEVTRDWTKLAFLVPAAGPSNVIGAAVLLWLCAKYRRASANRVTAVQVQTES